MSGSAHSADEPSHTHSRRGHGYRVESLVQVPVIHRAVAFAVAMAPIVAWYAVNANWAMLISLDEVSGLLLMFGPAIVAALGMAYAIDRPPLMWVCVVASVVSFAGLYLAYLSSLDSSTAALAFIWVSPAYVAICLAGWAGERQHEYRKWRKARL